MTAFTPLSLDQLPRYSSWPARLLGLNSFEVSAKTPQNVLREYNEDKWGAVLQLWEEHDLGSVEALEALVDRATPQQACLMGGELCLMSPASARLRYLEEIAQRLEPFANASALVEFGCGYGSILLRLARLPAFSRLPVVGTEFAPKGLVLFQKIAARIGVSCTSGACDLSQTPPTPVPIPRGSLLVTSWTLPYVPNLGPELFKTLAAYEPAIVCHIEPIVEHADPKSLLGQLSHRYNDFNHYGKGILAALRAAESEGVLDIITEEKRFFGLNPLLPVSFIAWRPRSNCR
jgi:hypothetical protein